MPQRNSRLAWLRRLPFTREGLFWLFISLAMLVTGLIKGINLINLLACWIIVLIVWNWWLARRQLRHLTAERNLPDFVFARTPFRWSVALANSGRKPASSVVLSEPTAPRHWFVGCVPPGSAVALEGETSLPYRGAFAWNTLRLTCGYPVGLARVARLLQRPQEILVLPQLGALRRGILRHWLNQHCPTQGVVRAAARRQPTAQLEFHGLRSFRPGDSPRHIHWRTTARRGELMVREFEDLPNDNLIVIVDAWTRYSAMPGADADLERLLSLAATICWEWCRQKGDDIALAIAGPTPTLIHGVTGRQFALDALKELARVNGSPAAAWRELLARFEATHLPDAAALVLSLRPDVPLDDLAATLRRPVACVNVAARDEQAFFTESS